MLTAIGVDNEIRRRGLHLGLSCLSPGRLIRTSYLRIMWLDAKLWVLRGNQSYMLKRLKIIAEAFVEVKKEDSFPYEINDRIRLVSKF